MKCEEKLFCTTLPCDQRFLPGTNPSDMVKVTMIYVNITYIIHLGIVLAHTKLHAVISGHE